MANNLLKGIRIVEMGTHVAIPYCSRELGDMGAEVIKVENMRGESYRFPMGALFQLPMQEDFNPVFEPYNVNKRGISLNLKSEEGRKALLKLLETADVFLTNTREAALERLGLSLESIHEKYPKLVIGSVNGFGTKGKDKDRGGYDATSFWSPSGMIQEWGYKENPHAFKPFYGFGDAITASQLAIGIMTALYNREKTGAGEIVRVSLLAAGLWQNVCGLVRYQCGHEFPKSFNDPIVPLDNFYKTKDGKWFLSSEEHWDLRYEAYFDLFGTPELKENPEWNSMKGYMTNIPEKVKYFEEHIAQVTSEQLTEALTKVDAVFEFLAETDSVLENPQAWDNDCFAKVKTRSDKELTISNMPIRFASQGLIDELKTAPRLGEHTAEILKEIGYSDEAIAEMAENKIALVR